MHRNIGKLLYSAIALTTLGYALPARAGTGMIDTTAKTIDLNVLFTYSETDANLNGSATPTWKQVFSKGSERLWNATNGQLRIGTVTVYIRALDKKDDADVWISESGGAAYATDVGVLGVPGQHMQFYGNKHRSLSGYLGDCSIAHEMGHYVFGLWDEYIGGSVPIDKKDTFTDADVRYEGNSPYIYSINSVNIVASLMDSGGGVPGSNQRTEFDTVSNIVKGVSAGGRWYMNKQWIKRRESCWETMSKLEIAGVKVFQDIPTGDSPNAAPSGFVDIVWNVVPSLSRLVLCVDRSGSMDTDNKMELAIAGASIFANLTQEAHTFDVKNKAGQTEDTITVHGDQLGVVDFDDLVTVDYPLTEVDEAGTVKTAALSSIAGLYARGSTAIGDGLQTSLNLITGAGDTVTQEAVVLLSDGVDNASSITPTDAALNCAARGARIFSIALGSDADFGTLANVASISNGKFYPAVDALGLLQIYPSIAAELKGGGLQNALGNFLHEKESTAQGVTVDKFAEEMTFSLSSVEPGFKFSIKSPSGHVYHNSSAGANVSYETSANELHFRVGNPEAGKWSVSIKAPTTHTNTNYQYALTNTVSSQRVNVSVNTSQSTYTYPDPIVFQCTVTAIDPVGNAEVMGKVTGPNGLLSYVTLYDDGLPGHGDETAGDGVYSASFAPPNGPGVYSIDVTVKCKHGIQAIVNPEKSDTPYVPQAIPPFERSTSANVMVAGAPAENVDWMRIDALDIRKQTSSSDHGKVSITAELNAPGGTFDPKSDNFYLYLYVGNGGDGVALYNYNFKPTGTPGVYKIVAGGAPVSGTLKVGVGGTSRSRFVFSYGNTYLGSTTLDSPFSVEIYAPNFNETVSLDATATPDGAPKRLSYLAKKNFAFTPTLFVDGIKAGVNHAKTDKDTLRIVTTYVGGGQDYDPATQTADVTLGKFTFTIPSGTLTKNNKNLLKGTMQIGGGSAQITIDPKRHSFILSGKKLELNGFFDRTMNTGMDVGSFMQTGVITTKQKFSGTLETLSY